MFKVLLLVLTIASFNSSVSAQSRYVYRGTFLCLDLDTCNVKTAVENRYPESALYLNITVLDEKRTAITAGKDWTAKEEPVSFYDTSVFAHAVGDTAYFFDANNDGRRDILFLVENQSRMGIGGQIDKWVLLVQGDHGSFEKLEVYQYGMPLWRRNRRNYWLSDRLVTDEKLGSRYWVKDLFELSGDRFKNVGARYGFPRVEQFLGKLPKLTKKLKRELFEELPGTVMEWIEP